MPPNDHDNLSAYLDGELSDAEVAELEAELARDPALRAELAELEDVVHWMRRDGPEPAPFGFHRRVMDRIEQEHPTPSAGWSWRRPFGLPLEGWLVGAAAAAVLWLALPRVGSDVNWPEPSGDERTGVAVDPDDHQQDDEAKDPDDLLLQQDAQPVYDKPVNQMPARRPRVPSVSEGDLPPIGVPPEAVEGPVDGTAQEGPLGELPQREIVFPPGFAFTMQGRNPGMKRQVLAVASRYGVPMGVAGQETSGTFESARETILVEVPTGRLAQLNDELSRLGYPVQGLADNELVRGPTMLVRIELELLSDDSAGD